MYVGWNRDYIFQIFGSVVLYIKPIHTLKAIFIAHSYTYTQSPRFLSKTQLMRLFCWPTDLYNTETRIREEKIWSTKMAVDVSKTCIHYWPACITGWLDSNNQNTESWSSKMASMASKIRFAEHIVCVIQYYTDQSVGLNNFQLEGPRAYENEGW